MNKITNQSDIDVEILDSIGVAIGIQSPPEQK
jgi:hypothetical protein